MLADNDVTQAHVELNKCHEFELLGDLKRFIRSRVREIIHYRYALCGLGEIRSQRILRVINVDFDPGYLQRVIRPGQVVPNSPVREWIAQRAPLVVDVDQIDDRDNSLWYSAARHYGIDSFACHGVVDVSSPVFSYFLFGGLDRSRMEDYPALLNLVVPHLHAALARILTTEHLRRTVDLGDGGIALPSRHTDQRARDFVRFDITDREQQVLQWVAAGKSNWEIGKILKISEFTVKNHVQNVLKKLAVTSRAQAVAKAISCGLICDDVMSSDLVDGG